MRNTLTAPDQNAFNAFFLRLTARLLWVATGILPGAGLAQAAATAAADPISHGPLIGHVDSESARIWARFADPGLFKLTVFREDGQPAARASSEALPGNDNCVVWRVAGLKAGQRYTYAIGDEHRVFVSGEQYYFHTAPLPDSPGQVRLAFGSCAHDVRFPSQPIWTAIKKAGAEVMVSLGDTPYIDSIELDVQRRRYRELRSVPELARTLRTISYQGVWDDHELIGRDTDGNVPGKEYARQAFLEYHANAYYGDGENEGVYSSFRWGPVEVFLLDTRWFAGTRPSPVAPGQPSLLGRTQWDWLTRGLRASTAPFKIVASGMVWNDAVRPNKFDHWMTYPHEREALFRFIGDNNISGVVLMGGDVHRSRVFRYPTEAIAGYPLTELITSPLANTVVARANVPSPYLLHDVGKEQTFLLVTVDTTVNPARLTAKCLDHEGAVHFSVVLDATTLTAGQR